MVAAAERIDQLPRALACIENDLLYKSRQRQKLQPITPAYPLVVMVITAFMTLMLMIFIAPKQRELLSDMGVQLPLVTRILFSFMVRWWEWLTAATTGLVLSVPMFIYLMFRPRRPAKPYLLSRAGDFLKWRLPVLRWFERNYALVQTASFLRLAISAGTTLDQAIAGAAELDVNIRYRRRLRRWLTAVRAGQDAAQSARECKVGPSLAWALDQRINPGNAPSILEMLEDFYRTRYGYLANLARFILWPCVTLLMAAVVGFVVIGFFYPYVLMNESAARSILP
jgi:type II secretory pathway component PulF